MESLIGCPTPQPLPRPPGRTLSAEQSSVETHKSSFAGTRQPSEDSKNIRFLDHGLMIDPPRRSSKHWQNVRRRLSIKPGLTKIHLKGHLNYKELRQRFERQSTFHGISHAALAPSNRWRWFWYIAFCICLCLLVIQIVFLVIKYRQYGKTVDLDLKFENAPFPSITLCNLNPYKKSAVNSNSATKAMMDAYAKRIAAGEKSEGVAGALAFGQRRVKRDFLSPNNGKRRKNDRRYFQALAQCLCDMDPMTAQRKGSCLAAQKGRVLVDVGHQMRNFHISRCLCQFDAISKTLWPCFPYSSWKEKICTECVDGSGHCPMRFYNGNKKYENVKLRENIDLCLCHKEYNHCIETREDGIILEIDPNDDLSVLNITQRGAEQLAQLHRLTTTSTTEEPAVIEALGFEEITDEIALATQAQQNLMFAVGSMSSEEKQAMSHQLDEFILKCSFNQKDCDLERDFKLYYDNTYGNCYTFNHNRGADRSSHRAGANYGLRLILYADVTEYLPTSESVGFRITVHDKPIVPFPDAFGYSAPTGFLSSYGVRMKQFIRLEKPYGHCEEGGHDEPDFVYTGFNYSVEACHRSCSQKLIISRCGCGDPMFPMPKHSAASPCRATDNAQRECLRNTTLLIGEMASKGEDIEDCSCHQPCLETNYEVTYSAARWPSGSAKVMECTPGDFMCLEKYRKNAAMLQIFYEELNYETLIETPAYTMTSLMADLGGLTGLWIGASVVSLLEIFALIVFATQAWVRKRKNSMPSSSLPHLTVSQKTSRSSLYMLHKTSTKQSVTDVKSLRSLRSNHSTKSRSKQSILIEEMPAPIQELSNDEEDETEGDSRSSASTRYLGPGDDLPCLCKYNDLGHITVMKALCPVHGYMVRRGYDYSLSNSEEDEQEGDDEVHKEEKYYHEPFLPLHRTSTRKGKSRPKSEVRGEPVQGTSGEE